MVEANLWHAWHAFRAPSERGPIEAWAADGQGLAWITGLSALPPSAAPLKLPGATLMDVHDFGAFRAPSERGPIEATCARGLQACPARLSALPPSAAPLKLEPDVRLAGHVRQLSALPPSAAPLKLSIATLERALELPFRAPSERGPIEAGLVARANGEAQAAFRAPSERGPIEASRSRPPHPSPAPLSALPPSAAPLKRLAAGELVQLQGHFPRSLRARPH